MKSEVKYMKEGSGEEEESSHGVENLEAGDGINKNKDMKEYAINVNAGTSIFQGKIKI